MTICLLTVNIEMSVYYYYIVTVIDGMVALFVATRGAIYCVWTVHVYIRVHSVPCCWVFPGSAGIIP